ncbi:hypothetical protein ABPG75_006417 [Micractinium tetrahymenae]
MKPAGLAAALAATLLLFAIAAAPAESLRLAAIGDYGAGSTAEGQVADMIAGFAPIDDILALGDNNYVLGENATIDAHIGQYYASYISPYMGSYGAGSSSGNHFWPIPAAQPPAPYHWYFPTLNGSNFYSQVLGGGLLEIFTLDSDCNEPAGTTNTSAQAAWLAGALAASSATWKLIMLHHAPYSSGAGHGSISRMQWLYERILKAGGFPYFVNGIGGDDLYGYRTVLEPGLHAIDTE